MNCFNYGFVTPGLFWLPCIISVLIFIGVICMICRLGRKGAFFNCCRQKTPDLAEEVAGLRKELEDIKNKLG